jgi:guanylate kinase
MRTRGSLFIISAPSGAGKTTLCKELMARAPGICPSVSFTTRAPRPGERNEVDYTFIDEPTFRLMISRGEFVEWAAVHGNLYGTSRMRLEALQEEGTDVLLDIDVQGARSLRGRLRGSISIFILPPSLDVLRQRLLNRRSNTPEDIEVRMGRARAEIAEYSRYDYVIINDVFETAFSELMAIILAARLRTEQLDPAWVEKVLV